MFRRGDVETLEIGNRLSVIGYSVVIRLLFNGDSVVFKNYLLSTVNGKLKPKS